MRRRASVTTLMVLALLVSACGDEAGTTTSAAVEATTSSGAESSTPSLAETSTTSLAETTTTAEMEHDDAGTGDPEITPEVAADVAAIRAGTARYVNDLDAATEDGFFIITQMIPDMGYHYLNPNIEGFEIGQPPILVYSRDGDDWELGAVEWVFPEEPAEPPMEGGTYGAFPAACHYEDGLFVPTAAEEECAGTHPDTEAAFTFWHPDLVTFHVWAWMHNPDGLYNGTNPLATPYNNG